MRQKFFQTSFLILLFIADVCSQTPLTKAVFYNLPIDQSKAQTIKAIESDPSLFLIDGASNGPRAFPSFNSDIKMSFDFIPKTAQLPSISIYDTKIYVDDKLQSTFATYDLTFSYSGNYRKAKKAYLILFEKIKNDYNTFKVHDCRLHGTAELSCEEMQTCCYIKIAIDPQTFPTCRIRLIKSKYSKDWTVTLTYMRQ